MHASIDFNAFYIPNNILYMCLRSDRLINRYNSEVYIEDDGH